MSMYGELRLQVVCGPGRAKQSMKDECDINRILQRYAKSGMLTHVAAGTPRYMDISEVGDYRSALEHLRSTEAFFAALPATTRARFNNDPAEFLDVASGLSPDALARELKLEAELLAPKKEAPAVTPAPPAQ